MIVMIHSIYLYFTIYSTCWYVIYEEYVLFNFKSRIAFVLVEHICAGNVDKRQWQLVMGHIWVICHVSAASCERPIASYLAAVFCENI